MSGTTVNKPRSDGNAGIEDRTKAVYLTAPSAVDTTLIRDALERKGYRTFSPDQLDVPGLNISETIREGMRQADWVIAVVGPEEESRSIYYEVGFAEALGKPSLVLLVGNVSADRWVIGGTPYFRFDQSNPSALQFGIDQFLKAPHHGSKRSSAANRSKPIQDRADEFLKRLQELALDQSPQQLAQEFESIIAGAIRASQVTSVSQGGEDDRFVDMAVWSDDLQPWVGNPLPIEVRMQIKDSSDLNNCAMRLQRQMNKGSLSWGLLIYLHAKMDIATAWMMPNILSIQAEQFIEDLRTTGFGDVVRALRNTAVHGAR